LGKKRAIAKEVKKAPFSKKKKKKGFFKQMAKKKTEKGTQISFPTT